MIYRIRVILDVEDDVFRDIEIESKATLEELHDAITQSFGFLGNEMASFYQTDDSWQQGEELPLIELDPERPSMQNRELNTLFNADTHKLLYVYDFLAMWTFFVELMEVADPAPAMAYPVICFAHGEVPEEPPVKAFDSASPESDLFLDDESDPQNEEDDTEYYY